MTDWTEWQKLEISRLREMQHDPARRFAFGTLVIEHADELLTAAEALARIRAIARDETDLGSFSQRVGDILDELDARQAPAAAEMPGDAQMELVPCTAPQPLPMKWRHGRANTRTCASACAAMLATMRWATAGQSCRGSARGSPTRAAARPTRKRCGSRRRV